METYAIFMTVLLSLLIGLVAWLQWSNQRQIKQLLAQSSQQLQIQSQSLNSVQLAQLALVDKAMALVGTADPLAYQSVQAMSPDSGYSDAEFDPSDESEAERISTRTPGLTRQEEALDGIAQDVLSDFGFSLD